MTEIEGNNYQMRRGWMKNDAFADEPFTEREAWIWLIENAQWKPRVVNIQGRPVKLERGQLSYSHAFMGQAWGWGRRKVQTFLGKLQKWGMVGAASGQGQTIITICKYNEYQLTPGHNGAAIGAGVGQPRGSLGAASGHNNNTGNTGNTKEPPPSPPRGNPPGASGGYWVDYGLVRLNRADYDALRALYPGTGDQFDNFLGKENGWMEDKLPPEDQRSWFIILRKRLEKLQREASA
jgi:hypothetical protein